MSPSRVKHLVVDSGGFIKHPALHELGENVYSIDSVVKEIRDKATKERLQFLPYKLLLKDPEQECYKYVLEFSKKTGDYSSLSATDLKVIALTYQLEKELVGTDHLNKEPKCQVSCTRQQDHKIEGFFLPEKEVEDDSSVNHEVSEASVASHVKENTEDETPLPESKALESDKQLSEEDEADSYSDPESGYDDDEVTWITPKNLLKVQKKLGNCSLESASDLTVACVTTDFAMQNVLLQMGLHVISVDGMLIKHAKMFILRCFACFKTTVQNSTFCSGCGNKTLKRVPMSVGSDGTKELNLNFRRPINIRGTKYSLPKPQGGKHSNNPILCADQPVPENRLPKSALEKLDIFSPDFLSSSSPFAFHDIHSRAMKLGMHSKMSHGRRNPNEGPRRTGGSKKKK